MLKSFTWQNPEFTVLNLLHLAVAWSDSIILYRENT
jgi:hypothetical protein